MKKFLSVLLAVLIVSGSVYVGTFSAAAVDSRNITADIEGNVITAKNVDGSPYLFLPSCADLEKLTVSSNGQSLVLGDVDIAEPSEVNVLSLATFDEATSSYVVKAGDGTDIHFMKSENTGAMYITTENKAYGRSWVDGSPDHSNNSAEFTTVTMSMQDENAKTIYDGKLTQLKGRGNSSWGPAKKPYQIKLDKKTDLLDTGNKENKNKTWVLLANYLDKTLLRNAYSFQIAEYLGMLTPEYKFVELYYDGEHRGSYMLTEKVQINSGRVDILNLEDSTEVADENATATATNSFGLEYQYNPTATCSAEDITGGYLLEQDPYFHHKENSWFETYFGSYVVIKEPECATKEQVEFISEWFNAMCKACIDGNCNGKDLTEYVDLDSLANLYVLNEYIQNNDFFVSSMFFFLPEQGNENYEHKLYAGPAWDYDGAFGSRNPGYMRTNPRAINYSNDEYYQGKRVKEAVKGRWNAIKDVRGILTSNDLITDEKTGLSSLPVFKSTIDASQKMNFSIWEFDSQQLGYCLPTYEENYQFMKDFIDLRTSVIFASFECRHSCHSSSKIVQFFWKIGLVISGLFGINQYCRCGQIHYK